MSPTSLTAAYCLLLASVAGIWKMAGVLPVVNAAGAHRGVETILLRRCTEEEEMANAVDAKSLWFTVKGDGSLLVNSDPIPWSNLPSLAQRDYEGLRNRFAYLYGEEDAPYGLVAQTGATLQQSADNLYIFLPTRSVARDQLSCTQSMYHFSLRYPYKLVGPERTVVEKRNTPH